MLVREARSFFNTCSSVLPESGFWLERQRQEERQNREYFTCDGRPDISRFWKVFCSPGAGCLFTKYFILSRLRLPPPESSTCSEIERPMGTIQGCPQRLSCLLPDSRRRRSRAERTEISPRLPKTRFESVVATIALAYE